MDVRMLENYGQVRVTDVVQPAKCTRRVATSMTKSQKKKPWQRGPGLCRNN